MRAWFIYRIKAPAPKDVIEAIANHAALIRRPDSQHTYHHHVEFMVSFSGQKEIGWQSQLSMDRQDAFWHTLDKEEDILQMVHSYRRDHLFKNLIAKIHPDMHTLMMQFSDLYAHIGNRQDERIFLKDCNQKAWTLFRKIREHTPSPHPRFTSLEQEWHDYTRVWRWTKRNTSLGSFPFLRPGVDVYKGYAFDLHGDEGKTWYVVVRFVY